MFIKNPKFITKQHDCYLPDKVEKRGVGKDLTLHRELLLGRVPYAESLCTMVELAEVQRQTEYQIYVNGGGMRDDANHLLLKPLWSRLKTEYGSAHLDDCQIDTDLPGGTFTSSGLQVFGTLRDFDQSGEPIDVPVVVRAMVGGLKIPLSRLLFCMQELIYFIDVFNKRSCDGVTLTVDFRPFALQEYLGFMYNSLIWPYRMMSFYRDGGDSDEYQAYTETWPMLNDEK